MRVALASCLLGLGTFSIAIAGSTDLLHAVAAGVGTACIASAFLMGKAWLIEWLDI